MENFFYHLLCAYYAAQKIFNPNKYWKMINEVRKEVDVKIANGDFSQAAALKLYHVKNYAKKSRSKMSPEIPFKITE